MSTTVIFLCVCNGLFVMGMDFLSCADMLFTLLFMILERMRRDILHAVTIYEYGCHVLTSI